MASPLSVAFLTTLGVTKENEWTNWTGRESIVGGRRKERRNRQSTEYSLTVQMGVFNYSEFSNDNLIVNTYY